jgi:hypothetical protein
MINFKLLSLPRRNTALLVSGLNPENTQKIKKLTITVILLQ